MTARPQYLSTSALVRRYGLPSKERFYALCSEVGWEKIRIVASTARELGVDTSRAPREWYYPVPAADQLWKNYKAKSGRG
jgi:hypothetical protein